MPTADLIASAPEIFLVAAICVVLLADVFLRDDQRNITYVLAMLALIGTAATTAYYTVDHAVIAWSGSFVTDPASGVLKLMACVIVGIRPCFSKKRADHARVCSSRSQ